MCLERGAEAVRCLLAIMKTGSGYLPPDPALPAARLVRICEPKAVAASHGSLACVMDAGGPTASWR